MTDTPPAETLFQKRLQWLGHPAPFAARYVCHCHKCYDAGQHHLLSIGVVDATDSIFFTGDIFDMSFFSLPAALAGSAVFSG
jgi:hypothetical protein